jgi:hypothetical protein
MNLRNGTSQSVLLLSLSMLSSAANRTGADRVPANVKAQALVNYAKRPLSFEENLGQAGAGVKFLSQGSDYSILLAPSEVSLNLRQAGKTRSRSSIRMSFPGAKSAPVVDGAERQSAISSYFIGNDPAKWVAGAANYARVRYRELYPGVDLAFYGNQGRLEYDFVVSPGANPKAIRLQFEGVDAMHLDRAGDLILSAANGQIRQHKPIIYQEGAGGRQIIEGRYVIQAHNRAAFEIARYDSRKPLVIDPTLSFGTYLGSPGDDIFGISATASTATYPAVATDSQGNVYLAGYNGGSAADFTGHPTTLRGTQGGGGSDVFVVKMNPTGTTLLYSVVFGASENEDVAGGIAVDTAGNAYITGHTNAVNFPITSGAAQGNNNGTVNAFVTEVDASGLALVYSTYLGGSGSFAGNAITVDRSGNAYVTGTAGSSGSTPFPLVSALSSTPSAGFLTEIKAGGTGFEYSTYLPAGTGIGYGIAVDSNGDAYVTGSTGSAGAPSPAQGYALKVNAGGASVGYGPVSFGSSGATLQTIGFGIALDAENNAYIAGMTNDPSFPQIFSAAQATYGGGLTDGFAAKLNSNGGLVYGTYIGGLGSNILPERGSGIAVDGAGNAYVSGTTQCIGFPTVNSIPGARNGATSVLMQGTVSGLNSNWVSTGLAGSFDQVDALAFDASGDLYAGTSAFNAAGGGIYKLPRGGSWTYAGSGIASTSIDAIAVDPNTPSTVYAAAAGHLYQTTTGGTSWTQLSQTVGTSAVIAIAKTSPSKVYVGSSTGLIYSTTPTGSWSKPTTPPPAGAITALIVDPNNPTTTAYAGTLSGVYKTVDGGSVWTAVNNGLPTYGPSGPVEGVTSLAINGSTTTIYTVTGSGLYYTTNAGANWAQAVIGEIPSTPVKVAVDAGNNVYVSFEAGMATGINGGAEPSDWSSLTYNGLTENPITALAVPPTLTSPPTAYVGITAATTAFLTEISPSGQSFLSSTCIGGSDNNLGQSVALASDGAIYVAGATLATNFPATPGAVQTSNAGLYDVFAVGIDVPPAQVGSPLPGIELGGTSETFSWNSVSGATEYQVTVGTTPGGTNIFSGTTTGTSQTVDFIPCTATAGGPIYVQLAAYVDGSFQTAATYTYSCKSAIGDFNGSGFQDLLWQNNSSGVTGQVNVSYYGGAGPQPQGSAVLNNGSDLAGWKVVGAGDFDHNGVQDLVLQNTASGQVNVNYYGGPGGTTVIGFAVLNSGAGMTGWSVVAVADMNGDGSPDLVWQNASSGEVVVDYYGGTGGATMTGSAVLNSGAGTAGSVVVAAADFDGNGTPDLVWQNQTTWQVTVNYYQGTTLIGAACLSCGINTANWQVVGAIDMNADGVPDLIYQNTQTSQVNVDYYGSGGGTTFKGWNCLNCGAIVSGLAVRAVAKFGGSGEPDLVYQNTGSNAVTVYYYGLGGAILQGTACVSCGIDTAGWQLVGTGDFDGNGVPDLVYQNTQTHQVNVDYYGGAGGTTFMGWACLSCGINTTGWQVVAVADFDGNGVPDVVYQNTQTGQVNVDYYGGSGGASFLGWACLSCNIVTTDWQVKAAADFDGNGVPDLVYQNTQTGQVNVDYYGGPRGASFIGWACLSCSIDTSGWRLVGASDFDGNGVPDLVYQNTQTGQVNVDYYGGPRGAVFEGWNVLSATGNPGWSVVVPRSR